MPRRPQTAKTASPRAREYKVRLPTDIGDRIEAKAKAEGWPQNRTVINLLAKYFDLEKIGTLADQLGHLENMLLKYGSRIAWQEMVEEYDACVDEVLKTQGAAQQVAIDKLRAVRKGMEKEKGKR
jgi:HEAT repeat protein